jgi:hypothetical protein
LDGFVEDPGGVRDEGGADHGDTDQPLHPSALMISIVRARRAAPVAAVAQYRTDVIGLPNGSDWRRKKFTR